MALSKKSRSTQKKKQSDAPRPPSAAKKEKPKSGARNAKKSSARGRRAVLVTGALGFIGSHVCQSLIKKGPVYALDRLHPDGVNNSRANALKKAGVQFITADLADPLLPQILEETLHQCDALVHTAAPVKEKGPLEDFRAINVQSTLALARKAADCGLRRWTQLSSVMVYGFDYPPEVAEEGPLRGDGNPYCITKIESEHALLGLSGKGMDVVILRPGDVYGPGSVPWVIRPLEMMKKKQFLLLDGGRYAINHTHVSHIVQAVELALRTRGGQIFNITDGISSSCLEYFGALASTAGFPAPPSIPSFLARSGALLMEMGSALIGREAQLNREALKFVMRPHTVNSQKARALLGLRPTVSLTQGLDEIHTWLKEERPDLQGPDFKP
ncbi:MAG: NAD(P)-dependent oxidoreductase [Leptospiraceae bacterium]|nr:NAD(P)-dependent oxidoreductase [Leptospiraceae bacterium]